MTEVGMFVDTVTLDEARLIQSARQHGVDLRVIDTRRLLMRICSGNSVSSNFVLDCASGVINRARLGQRRKDLAFLFQDSFPVVNCYDVEARCQDKLYFYSFLARHGIPVPQSFAALYSGESSESTNLDAEQVDAELGRLGKSILENQEIAENNRLAYKLRCGTHAHGIRVISTTNQLLRTLQQRLRRTPGNPLGFLFQKFHDKPFDYRLVMTWTADGESTCVACLMRCALTDEDLVTSTSHGRPSVGLNPSEARPLVRLAKDAVDCIRERGRPGLIGLDLMPSVPEETVRTRAYQFAQEISPFYEKINEARRIIDSRAISGWASSYLEEFDTDVRGVFKQMHETIGYKSLAELGIKLAENSELFVLDGNTAVDHGQNTFYNCGTDLLPVYLRIMGVA